MAGIKRERGCLWHFDPQTGQDEGPNDALTQNFKKSPYVSLIRESIQNSLDAVADETKPVVVSVSLHHLDSLQFPNFFELKKHIQGCIDLYPRNDNALAIYRPMLSLFSDNYHQQIHFITVADYNTKGMRYQKGDTNCPFYAFALSKGVSAKENQSSGGSFGFGKAAYFNVSPIRTVFISSQTSDGQNVFEGVSSLCTHLINGQKLTSVGYYDNNDGLPVTDIDNIPSTFRRTEPGTSVSILGFNPSEQDDAIKEMKIAVLRSFWMAIYNNKLAVSIDGYVINSGNIADVMEENFPSDIDTTRKSNYYNPRPYFDAVRLATYDGKRYVKIATKIPVVNDVELYINFNPDVNDKVVFMRKPLMFVYSKKQSTSFGYNAVFVCTSVYGNKILKNIENPAHDEWKAENWKDGMRTKQEGKDALDAIQNFINSTLDKLTSTGTNDTLQIVGLEDYLYVPEYLVSDDDTTSNTESPFGMPNGEYIDESGSVTSVISNTTPTSKANDNTHVGHVIISQPGSTEPSAEDDSENLGTGHSNKRSRKKGGGVIKWVGINLHLLPPMKTITVHTAVISLLDLGL